MFKNFGRGLPWWLNGTHERLPEFLVVPSAGDLRELPGLERPAGTKLWAEGIRVPGPLAKKRSSLALVERF